MLLDKGSKSAGVGTLKCVDDTLVLEEEESRHSANTVALCDWLHSIDVNLEEDGIGILWTEKGGGVVMRACKRVGMGERRLEDPERGL